MATVLLAGGDLVRTRGFQPVQHPLLVRKRWLQTAGGKIRLKGHICHQNRDSFGSSRCYWAKGAFCCQPTIKRCRAHGRATKTYARFTPSLYNAGAVLSKELLRSVPQTAASVSIAPRLSPHNPKELRDEFEVSTCMPSSISQRPNYVKGLL